MNYIFEVNVTKEVSCTEQYLVEADSIEEAENLFTYNRDSSKINFIDYFNAYDEDTLREEIENIYDEHYNLIKSFAE